VMCDVGLDRWDIVCCLAVNEGHFRHFAYVTPSGSADQADALAEKLTHYVARVSVGGFRMMVRVFEGRLEVLRGSKNAVEGSCQCHCHIPLLQEIECTYISGFISDQMR